MLNVASAAKLQALKQSQAHGSKPSTPNERPQGAFESMLDDSSAQASAVTKEPVSKDKTTKEPATKDQVASADRTSATAPKSKADKPETKSATKSDKAEAKADKPETNAKPSAEPQAAQVVAPEGGEKTVQLAPSGEALDVAALPQEMAVAATVAPEIADESETDGEAEGETESAAPAEGTVDQPQLTAEPPQAVAPAPPQPTILAQTPAAEFAPDAPTIDETGEAPVVAAVAPPVPKQPLALKDQVADAPPAPTDVPEQAAKPAETTPTLAVPAETPEAGTKPAVTKQATPAEQAQQASQAEPAQPATPAKPAQAAPITADKEHIAQARGETADKGRGEALRAEPATPSPNASADLASPSPNASAHAAMHTSAATTTMQTAAALPANASLPVAVPLAGVGVEIATKAAAGKNNFEIRLDPPELGRIEVRLNVDRDGNVTSILIADRQDTLDLLKRDSSGLERALQDAGLKTSSNGMEFSLRDQSPGQRQDDNGHKGKTAHIVIPDETAPNVDIQVNNYGRLAGGMSGLDIRV